MCVIIAIPKGVKVDENEIRDAWNTNDDGAGYMYRHNGKVFYKRGFMDIDEYIEEVMKLIGKYEIVLHLRISTSDKVNPTQTHPYELGDIMNMEGVTTNPVSCMNGVVSNKRLEMLEECNDTMSYIVQNNELFKKFMTIDDDKNAEVLIDFIKEHSGAKWCVMTPNDTFISGGFTEENNVLYSNLNHRCNFYTQRAKYTKRIYMEDILPQQLIFDLNKSNWTLKNEVYDYISEYCNQCDNCCKGCLKKCKTVKDLQRFKRDNIYDFNVLLTGIEAYNTNDYDFYDYKEDDMYYTSSVKDDYIFYE